MWLRPLIRAFDAFLCRCYGIVDLSGDPACLLRVRVTKAARAVALPEAVIPAGAQVLELHLVSERIPPVPPEGPDLAWARRGQRMFLASLQEAARRLREDACLAGVQAVAGSTVLASGPDGLERDWLLQRLGFSIFPAPSPLGRFGRFWENAYTWTIMWTYSPSSLRARRLRDLRRDEFWMARDRFLERFGR